MHRSFRTVVTTNIHEKRYLQRIESFNTSRRKRNIILYYIKLYFIMLYYIISYYIISYYITLCYIILYSLEKKVCSNQRKNNCLRHLFTFRYLAELSPLDSKFLISCQNFSSATFFGHQNKKRENL